uniref:Protein asunder homolog n=1 Tax=Phallusia mammillata TaxID=59560 RepID=A0A6F9DG31_9ASCI|nr:protein asunder homolog [Phallusia mammillata]
MDEKMFGIDHKTVFVLDHGQPMIESSKQMVDFDISTKSRPQGVVPLAPVSKSLWSSCMEALCEYCRIVWDIFPADKLLRFIVSDSSAKFLNTWSEDEQTMAHLMRSLASVGPPLKKPDCSVMLGLVSAVEALCEMTPCQQKLAPETKCNGKISNSGRIICITQLKNDTHKRTLEDCVADAVSRHSELAAKSDGMLPIENLNLVLVHVKPFGSDFQITESPPVEMKSNPKITVESHNVKATRHGIAVANRMLNLLRHHYDLSVTSITGIPMKEEQHANSSANYDVLLLHRRLPGTLPNDANSAKSDGELNSTMLLKWCTPKINANELYHCTGAARISPVDVNSRPSLCLTNFLQTGRSVLLEHWKKGPEGGAGSSFTDSATKTMTHMISCRGSDIFLQALGVSRVPFEDPPSITDGPGGRVTDYRINNFSSLIKEVQLLPLGAKWSKLEDRKQHEITKPLSGAIAKLDRHTRCWPLVISKTIIFNMGATLERLLEIIVKEKLTADDVVQCQRTISHLGDMERNGTSLPSGSPGGNSSRGSTKHPNRDDQYRAMWGELESLLQSHSTTSLRHAEVLDCLVERVGKNVKSDLRKHPEVTSLSQNVKTEVSESPESPPPVKKQKVDRDTVAKLQKGKQSLLSLWNQRIDNKNSQRHVEFYGRLASDGNQARLYPNIEEDSSREGSATPTSQNQRHGGHQRFSHHHRGSSGGREDSGRSGRLTPQGKQKIKKEKKSYSQAT